LSILAIEILSKISEQKNGNVFGKWIWSLILSVFILLLTSISSPSDVSVKVIEFSSSLDAFRFLEIKEIEGVLLIGVRERKQVTASYSRSV
jgi:hypothetical protein